MALIPISIQLSCWEQRTKDVYHPKKSKRQQLWMSALSTSANEATCCVSITTLLWSAFHLDAGANWDKWQRRRRLGTERFTVRQVVASWLGPKRQGEGALSGPRDDLGGKPSGRLAHLHNESPFTGCHGNYTCFVATKIKGNFNLHLFVLCY